VGRPENRRAADPDRSSAHPSLMGRRTADQTPRTGLRS
jgi:hypothetical protein